MLAASVVDGNQREIYTTASFIGRLQWMPDNKGLVIILSDPLTGLRGQLWYLSYPGGQVRRITNDLSNYDSCCISMMRDGGTFAVIEDTFLSDVSIAPEGVAEKARQITSAESVVDASWITNDKIVMQNTRGDLLLLDRDGKNRLSLADEERNYARPSGCGLGRYLSL